MGPERCPGLALAQPPFSGLPFLAASWMRHYPCSRGSMHWPWGSQGPSVGPGFCVRALSEVLYSAHATKTDLGLSFHVCIRQYRNAFTPGPWKGHIRPAVPMPPLLLHKVQPSRLTRCSFLTVQLSAVSVFSLHLSTSYYIFWRTSWIPQPPCSSRSELLNREAKTMSLLRWSWLPLWAYKVLHTPHVILCSPDMPHAPAFCTVGPASGPLHLLLPLLSLLFLPVSKGWLFHFN